MQDKWKSGLSDEISFWDRWMKTKGSEWPDDFIFRCDPNTDLQHHICELIDAPAESEVRILDVGAGPLTCLGKSWTGRKVTIFPVDALAEDYDALLIKYGITPLVRTAKVHAEKLASAFAPDFFDLAYAQNSLDHCYDPLTAIRQMIEVVRPNHFVLLAHALMEGENENYQGLHQWDFFCP